LIWALPYANSDWVEEVYCLRIGVISDTHMRAPSRAFLDALRAAFAGVTRVLHCGDWVDGSVLDAMAGSGWEVLGVAGNMDPLDVQRRLPRARTIVVEDTRIGLIHGWGSPQGIEARVSGAFQDVDIVVFGHTHRPYWGCMGGVWLFNPGSACGWGSPMGPTVGILEVGERMEGRIVPLDPEEA
jgi:uncharacterized protein